MKPKNVRSVLNNHTATLVIPIIMSEAYIQAKASELINSLVARVCIATLE